MTWQEMIALMFGLLLLTVFVTSPVTCTIHRHQMIAAAIEAGADPIEAKCAIESDNDSSALCAAAMRQRAKRLVEVR